MYRRLTCAFIAFLSMSAAGVSPCRAEPGADVFTGPADVHNQRPYQALFLSFSPESARVLPQSRSVESAQLHVINMLLIPEQNNGVVVDEDTEIEQLALKYRRGLGSGLEASVALPIDWRTGGFLDKLIETYHYGIHNVGPTRDIAPGREGVSAYNSHLILTDASGKVILNAGPTFGMGDLQATLKRGLFDTRWTAASIRAGVKLPTGNASSLLGSGGTDYGVSLDIDQRLSRRVCLYANLSYVKPQRASYVPARTVSGLRHGVIAVEYAASRRSSWILQNDIGDAAIRTGNDIADGNQAIITLAYRFRASPGTIWTLGFEENNGIVRDGAPWLANTGPDPVVTVGWERSR